MVGAGQFGGPFLDPALHLVMRQAQCFFGPLPLDALGDPIRHRSQHLEGRRRERSAGERRHDPHHTTLDDQRVAGEADHPFPPSPFAVTDPLVVEDVVGQVGTALPGDEADLERADRHARVGPVEVGVDARTGLQLQDGLVRVERPDAGEGGAEAVHEGFGASLKERLQVGPLGERDADLRAQVRQLGPLAQGLLRLFALGDLRHQGVVSPRQFRGALPDPGLQFVVRPAQGILGVPPGVAGLLLLQGLRHRLSQPGQPVLEQVVGGALPEALDGGLVAEGAGDHDDRHVQAPLPHQVEGEEGVEPGQVVVGEDEVGGRVEAGEEVGLGLHPLAGRLVTGASELVEDQASVVLAVFEQEHAERSGHRRLLLLVVAPEPLLKASASRDMRRGGPARRESRTYRSMRMCALPSWMQMSISDPGTARRPDSR